MSSSSDETELLTQFRRGDRAAFDALYTRYAPGVFAFARRLTGGNTGDAEDLTQETFVAAFRGAAQFRGGARLSTWLMAIALRRFRDKTRHAPPPSAAVNENDPSPAVPVEAAALHNVAFERALAVLDPNLRAAFLLVAGQGLTHREAAAILQIPIGTAKWRVAEAARRLRSVLSDTEPAATSAAPVKETAHVSPL